MSNVSTLEKTMRCNLMMTNNARKGIQEWSADEHDFFNIQKSFQVYIEKRPVNAQGNISLSLYFDNIENLQLTEKLDGKVAIMDCVLQNNGFLATGFHVRGSRVPVQTNRRLPINLSFVTSKNNGAGLPIQLHTKIRELPVAEERSEYVKKRISSWEGYLKIQERNADIADITASFSKLIFNEDFSRMSLVGCEVNGNEWNKIRGLSISFKGYQNDIGDVLKANRNKNTIEIELRPRIREMARKNSLNPKAKEVVFSNFATLSQIRRLRKGFEDLQNGLAANANLEKILFEDRPTIRITNKQKELEFHNRLNEFQQEAVVGAMSAEDLYVIQGPPGTGKTTVISEICQQNAKAGLRTLVASQSNLAVDNALSRLLSNKEIRILRFGRTESIEEEGKRFIEENVGQYWKEQTLATLSDVIEHHASQENLLKDRLNNIVLETKSLDEEKQRLIEAIEKKVIAQTEYDERSQQIRALKKSLVSLKKEREEIELTIQSIGPAVQQLAQDIKAMEQFLEANPSIDQLTEQTEQLTKKLDSIQDQILYQKSVRSLQKAQQEIENTREQHQKLQKKLGALEALKKEIQTIRKVDELKERLKLCGIVPSFLVNRQMEELDLLIESIKSSSDWQELNARLSSAIAFIEKLLKKHKYPVESVKSNMGRSGVVFDSNYTVKEIHQFMNRLKHIMTSDEEELTTEKLAILLEGLYVREKFVLKQQASIQLSKSNSITKYQAIKAQVATELENGFKAINNQTRELIIVGTNQKHQLTNLEKQIKDISAESGDFEGLPTQEALETSLLDKQKKRAALDETLEKVSVYSAKLGHKKAELEKLKTQLQEQEDILQKNEQEAKMVNAEGLDQEKRLKILDEIILQNPENALKKLEESYTALEKESAQIHIELERLPITQALQTEWFSLLQEANDHDLDEIRKLYVRHANVIGTTCVASARKEFMENYPTFDVVIIDEVSKATPPELLLPMLKGKKIILVGDHHQLPPLVGEDTLDETLQAILEESDSFEEKEELKKLLKESLFERLFKNLPKSNKTMLAIQYRMHESIMETITPFYEEENYRLQCGLTDSDAMRDHLLDSEIVKRTDHLLWVDMPNEKRYFEERMKDGKSRFNQAELDSIRKILIDLDKATEKAKQEGRMEQHEKKSIGVISFYGEQVKRIDRLIQQEMNLKHLHFRTGTVDKFQGMEMDVILLSMVRNNQDKSGDIGFANDYRRLNVALSRARELLVIVGSVEMFTKRAKQKSSREMYGRLKTIVKQKEGFRDPDVIGQGSRIGV
ncbi:AAA domain-containing protein [Psychrobacillus sp. BL-248-WT-3]|uniref:AAA domain-containing protein n=1 Tax=Psychrobacillus sp. BL-248-WT-3 TaxID=2725306 RepID=UPI00146E9360|nr:AAA domain-containing protein [Psychrobacillus sp. BL-248-WT-3]NME06464.1 AAA family ATPase [Psychrobacillus sp. BL-248-WT-3]